VTHDKCSIHQIFAMHNTIVILLILLERPQIPVHLRTVIFEIERRVGSGFALVSSSLLQLRYRWCAFSIALRTFPHMEIRNI